MTPTTPKKRLTTCLAWILCGAGAGVCADPPASFDWPEWQGPDRNAISKERGLLREWPKGGPPLVWKVTDLGGGDSAPSIAAGRIFGMSHRGEDEVVWALSEADGKELWVTRLGAATRQRVSQGKEGPGCTPTVDGERLYVLGLAGDLACLRVRDGAIEWRHSLTRDSGGRAPTWSYRESPLVDGDKVICTPGAEDAVLVALDKLTGKTIWKSRLTAPPAGGAPTGADPGRGEREGGQATPASPTAPPAVVIPAGSRWKYLDKGASPGPEWTQLGFKDDTWREGPAQFGYGDGDEATRIDDSPDSYPSYYFRRKFEVKDPSLLKPLVLRLLRDDGALVFINGSEVCRDNLPAGSIGHDSYAVDANTAEDTFHVHDVAPGRLVSGTNIIAVEVHQANANSSDVSFDLELREKIPGQDVVGAPPAARRPGFGAGRNASEAAYSSAIAIDFGGERQYVQFLATTLVGVAASDGRLLWRFDRPANTHRINCSTPIYQDGMVFASSAYDGGSGLAKLVKDANGAIQAEEVYFSEDVRSHHGGFVLLDGCLYGANGGNEGGALACLDFKTGKVLWDEEENGKRRARKGSVTLADGRLYYRTEEGTLLLIEPNPKEYVERGRFEQPERTRLPAWAHPVVANGKLYVRDQGVLFSYDVKAK